MGGKPLSELKRKLRSSKVFELVKLWFERGRVEGQKEQARNFLEELKKVQDLDVSRTQLVYLLQKDADLLPKVTGYD